jgi:hypothetical protein
MRDVTGDTFRITRAGVVITIEGIVYYNDVQGAIDHLASVQQWSKEDATLYVESMVHQWSQSRLLQLV